MKQLLMPLLIATILGAATLVTPIQITPPSTTGTWIFESVLGKIGWVSVPASATQPIPATEVLVGTLDGTNAVFTTLFPPIPNTQIVHRNGLAVFPGSGDYSISGNTYTFNSCCIPRPGDQLVVVYWH